ncbi:MAG TPA: ATP synthase A1 subunit C [Candidatus Thermoplasmatota archaeon]|nr:ATP synthase A1 subunit C [Candidatus Thermoplasmatota archaeon]
MAKLTLASLSSRLFSGNYPYVTARVRAKKPKLLPKEQYQRLATMSPPEIARSLQEGTYRKEIDELAQRYTGARLVEMATRLNLARTYTEVRGFARGEVETVVTLILQRYDVYNVKTILRGKFANVPPEEVQDQLVPAGALSADDLAGLLRLGSMEEVVERLQATPYGDILKESLARGVQSLTDLENALDKRYYAQLLHAVEPGNEPNRAFLKWVRFEIDALNLKTALRLRADRIEELGDLHVPGGSETPEERVKRWLRASPDELQSDVASLPFGKGALAEKLRGFVERGELSGVVAALDKQLILSAQSFSHRYPLSVLPVVDYVLRKKVEVDNLRVLALGKAAGLPEATLKELLIV